MRFDFPGIPPGKSVQFEWSFEKSNLCSEDLSIGKNNGRVCGSASVVLEQRKFNEKRIPVQFR